MEIRPARLDELYLISNLWLEMVGEEGETHPNRDWWIHLFYNKLRYNLGFMLVAEDEGKLVGYISGEVYLESSDGKIHGISQHIYVQPKYRNGRVGLSLYHGLAKIFVGQGAEVIEFLCKQERIPFWGKKGYHCKLVVMSKNARDLREAYK